MLGNLNGSNRTVEAINGLRSQLAGKPLDLEINPNTDNFKNKLKKLLTPNSFKDIKATIDPQINLSKINKQYKLKHIIGTEKLFDDTVVKQYAMSIQGLNQQEATTLLQRQGLSVAQQQQVLTTAKMIASNKALNASLVEETVINSTLNGAQTEELLTKLGVIDANTGELVTTKQVTIAKVEETMATMGIVGADAEAIVSQLSLASANTTAATTTNGFTTAIKANIVAIKTWMASNPIGWIMLIISAIAASAFALYKFNEKAEEKIETIKKNAKEAKEAIDNLRKSFRETKKTTEDISERFAELSQGIDSITGKNISLSDEDYEEFLDLSNQLAELFPSLTRTYDENGNAIVKLSGNIDTIVGSLQSLVDVERDLANQEIAKKLPDIYDGAIKNVQEYEEELYDELRYAPVRFEDQVFKNRVIDVNYDLYKDNAYDVNKKFVELATKYGIFAGSQSFFDQDDTKVYDKEHGILKYKIFIDDNASRENIEKFFNDKEVKKILEENNPDAFVNEINSDYVGKTKMIEDKIKNEWSNLAYDLMSGIQADGQYKTLRDTAQTFVQNAIGNLDYDALVEEFGSGKEGYEKLNEYIQDNILGLFNNSDVMNLTTQLFELDFSKMPLDEIKPSIMEYVNKIVKIAEELDIEGVDSDFLLKIFGLENTVTITDNYNKIKDSIARSIVGVKDGESMHQGQKQQYDGLIYKIDQFAEEYSINTQDEIAAFNDAWEKANGDIDKAFMLYIKYLNEKNRENSFLEVFNAKDFKEQREELLKLAKAGELTPETLKSTEEYQKLLDKTGLSAESCKDKIYNLLINQEKLAAAHTGLDNLKSLYEEFSDLGFVTAKSLESLPDEFKKLKGYNLFSRIAGDPKNDIDKIQQAFNDIVKEYLIFTQTLNSEGLLNEDLDKTNQNLVDTTRHAADEYKKIWETKSKDIDPKYIDLITSSDSELNNKYLNAVKERKEKYKGSKYAGNVDLYNRPILLQDDGTYETLKSETFMYSDFGINKQGAFNVTPILPDGTKIDNLGQYILDQLKDGKKLEDLDVFMGGDYSSIDEAVQAVIKLHEEQDQIYGTEAKYLQQLKEIKGYEGVAIEPIDDEDYEKVIAVKEAYDDLQDAENTYSDAVSKQNKLEPSELQQRAMRVYAANLREMGITNAEEVVQQTIDSLKASKDLIDKAEAEYDNYLESKNQADLEFIESSASYNSQLINSMGVAYKTDYDNWIDSLEAKKNAYELFKLELQKIDNSWSNNGTNTINSDYLAERIKNGEYFNEGELFAMGLDSATMQWFMSMQSDYQMVASEAEKLKNDLQAKYTFKELDLSLNFDGSDTSGGLSSGSDKTFDWIETKLENLNEELDKTKETAEDTFSGWKVRTGSYKKAENQIKHLINVQTAAKAKYMEEANKSGLSEEYKRLVEQGAIDITKLSDSAADQKLKDQIEYYQEWYNKAKDCDDAIVQLEKDFKEMYRDSRTFRWETFDTLVEQISRITEETEYFIGLLSEEDLFDDNGNMTKYADATLGLHLSNIDTYKQLAKDDLEEIDTLQKEILSGGADQETIDRYNTLIDAHRDNINAIKDEEQAIIDLVSQGYELQLKSLQEIIDKKKESLNAEKSLYDYQKSIEEKTKNVTSLQRQYDVYKNDDSEEGIAQAQRIKLELEKAQEDLEQTEYEKYLSDQEAMLDQLSADYEEWMDARLEDENRLLEEIRDKISGEGDSILSTLQDIATENDTVLSKDIETSIVEGATTAIDRIADAVVNALGGNEEHKGNAGTHKAYASGTKRSGKEWAWTQEKGVELIRTKDGALLTPLDNSMVFNNESSRRLWEFSQNPVDYLNKLGMQNIAPQIDLVTPRMPELSRNISSPVINLGGINIVCNEVSNADDIVNDLISNKKFEKAMFSAVGNAMTGGNSLNKFRY